MNSELTESVQQSIRPGEMVDTFYYGETNLEKQAYPCVVDNRFNQSFTNLGAGTSQFVISPKQGVSDIVLTFVLPLDGVNGAAYVNSGFGAGWGYDLINRVSVRYGSSAQYFWSGQQLQLLAMYDCENKQKAEDMINLGGNALIGVAGVAANPNAYVYLRLPHCSPRAEGKPLPFPSDLLVQPIVITVELNTLASIMRVGGGGGAAPNALASALLQVKQETMSDSSDLLSRRVDMNTNAYTYPLMYFAQQEVQVPVAASVAQSVNLTGFRAGEVKSILLWLEDTTATNNTYKSIWAPIRNAKLTYNGEIFADFRQENGSLWNLITDTKVPQIERSAITSAAPPVGDVETSYWLEIPFSQVNLPYDKEAKLVHGKPILNAVVNLTFDAPDATGGWLLHAQYIYNASLLCSRGSAEYIF
jgi:hypothetical protein